MTNSFFESRSRQLLAVLLLLTFSLSAASCKTGKSAAASGDTLPQALLWKIEGNGLSKPSYLFGTIHIMPREYYFYPSGFETAFAESDRIVFEIDLNELDDMGSLMGMMTGLMMKGGTSLDDLLSPSEYSEVSGYFEDMGLPMFLLNKVKPMFLSMLADVDMNPDALGGEDMVSYEMELNDRAGADGKRTGGLETMAYQMSLFDSIPYKDQALMLLDAVRGTQAESDAFQDMVKMYGEQRIEDMVAMIDDAGQAGGEEGNYEEVLLVNRNKNWIPVMGRMMQRETVMFAVGAGHLGGEQGVVRLLRAAGYTVTPVSVHTGAKRI